VTEIGGDAASASTTCLVVNSVLAANASCIAATIPCSISAPL
jgi:hypothetical protein